MAILGFHHVGIFSIESRSKALRETYLDVCERARVTAHAIRAWLHAAEEPPL